MHHDRDDPGGPDQRLGAPDRWTYKQTVTGFNHHQNEKCFSKFVHTNLLYHLYTKQKKLEGSMEGRTRASDTTEPRRWRAAVETQTLVDMRDMLDFEICQITAEGREGLGELQVAQEA